MSNKASKMAFSVRIVPNGYILYIYPNDELNTKSELTVYASLDDTLSYVKQILDKHLQYQEN